MSGHGNTFYVFVGADSFIGFYVVFFKWVRYPCELQDIRAAVSKLQSKVSAKVVPLTEGFKSMYA